MGGSVVVASCRILSSCLPTKKKKKKLRRRWWWWRRRRRRRLGSTRRQAGRQAGRQTASQPSSSACHIRRRVPNGHLSATRLLTLLLSLIALSFPYFCFFLLLFSFFFWVWCVLCVVVCRCLYILYTQLYFMYTARTVLWLSTLSSEKRNSLISNPLGSSGQKQQPSWCCSLSLSLSPRQLQFNCFLNGHTEMCAWRCGEQTRENICFLKDRCAHTRTSGENQCVVWCWVIGRIHSSQGDVTFCLFFP